MNHVAKKVTPVTHLFCGVRGFRLLPIFYSFTTLDAFLVNVPLDELTQPQQLMADGADALRYAKLLKAESLIPCADGGAPWYWREGMGPKYPGFPGDVVEGASPYEENEDADPYPERVGGIARVLRPGEPLHGTAHAPFKWPFAPLRQE